MKTYTQAELESLRSLYLDHLVENCDSDSIVYEYFESNIPYDDNNLIEEIEYNAPELLRQFGRKQPIDTHQWPFSFPEGPILCMVCGIEYQGVGEDYPVCQSRDSKDPTQENLF